MPPETHEGKMIPPEAHGVKVVSMGFFLPDNEPVVWRGPMLGRAIEQFLGDVLWGSPDYLLIDLPPGTGDIALTIAQMIPGAELIIVTTPQEAAARTAVKAAKMAQMTKQRVLGVVENMAYFVCPDCGSRHYIFGRGGAFEIARLMDTRLLGRIPLDEATREGGDTGLPAALDPIDAGRGGLRGHRQGARRRRRRSAETEVGRAAGGRRQALSRRRARRLCYFHRSS